MDETPESISIIVCSVLQMYSVFLDSYEQLSEEDKSSINALDITFHGFDGSKEIAYYGYCKFVLRDMGAYPKIYGDGKISFNTHSPYLPEYQRMLDTWKTISSNEYATLTKDQLLEIIQSRYDDYIKPKTTVRKVKVRDLGKALTGNNRKYK